MKKERLVVGLDVGTTKVCAVVAEVHPFRSEDEAGVSSELNIIGMGKAPARGIRKGVITNIEHISESIRAAVREAENTAGVDIKAVHTGLSGSHIGCLSSNGVIAVKEKEIGDKEVDSVIDAARAMALPFDREMLHVIPVGFTVNGQNGITDPRGMGGVRLETKVRIITGAATAIQNLIRSCQKAGLEVDDVVFQPLASAETVLTPDEKELGVAVIDIGGGTTDIALFQEGNISHAAVLSIGGNNFTNDVAVGLRMPANEAEVLKRNYGCSMLSMVKEGEEVETGHAGGKAVRRIPRNYLVEILQPRAEELFSLVKREIVENGFHKHMNAGVVLTGGAVLMDGMDVMAENILDLPVRIGGMGGVGNSVEIADASVCAAGAGLALYGAGEEYAESGNGNEKVFAGITNRMKALVGGLFR